MTEQSKIHEQISKIEEFRFDKSHWDVGPWQSEPDYVRWEDSNNFICVIERGSSGLAHLCGYVGVPPSHPLYQQGYDDVDLYAHGGITYAGERGEEGVWFFGFDCAHAGDRSMLQSARMAMGLASFLTERTEIYRDMEYVRNEIVSLSQQLQAHYA